MHSMIDLFSPFIDYAFMRRALMACCILAISSAPLGVFLVARRMTLIGDAAAHAILPGTALAFIYSGLALGPLMIGGLAAGLGMAFIAGLITRISNVREDASLTAAYLTSLAIGVLLISKHGSSIDLLHMLFGNVLAVDDDSLRFIASIASLSLVLSAVMYRSLILECVDPSFLKIKRGHGALSHQIFLMLVVLNLVSACQALGTLMAVGIMILPAITTRFWTKNIDTAIGLAITLAILSSMIGLLLSYHWNLPSGPSIILTSSMGYGISVLLHILKTFFPRKHLIESRSQPCD